MAALVVVVVVALAAALVASQAWIIVGMFRDDRGRRPPSSAADPSAFSGSAPRVARSASVIIPAHNEEQRLPATLASLGAIEYEGEIEFVLVDDRSSDATGRLMAKAAAADGRFKLVTVVAASKRYAPKVNAVMQGIKGSSGEVIVTSDADCSYSPRWVSALVEHLADDVVMVCGYVETLPPAGARG
ncbi:MAG TPA: glycosyltransferase, partial [Trueperaceae bacterium]|nr:glycosyltransferase [Trueperaceae bacterium]